ncbi:MAG: hypothetical protein Q8N98_03190, partial [bacterium]|nr:hypothetical protein [bacterium]
MKAASYFFFYLFLFFLPTQLGRHFWPEWAIINGIRVDYLSPTIFLTDILLFLSLGSWGVRGFWDSLKTLKQKKGRTKQLFFVETFIKSKIRIGFFIVTLVLIFLNLSPAGLIKIVKILEMMLLGFYVAKNFREEKLIRCGFVLLSMGLALQVFIALGQ